ncbi:peptide-binding protein [Fischerella thermalis CCMEE 5205]|uniref:Peptide-binding protein n=1 Tax=Fischerella thermalis CCMEE 5318 TaxID=2019666 RepID=A0A2N6LNF9_9CYAN|nr:FHA domain-containing protein [Fischerella thermalis]PMB27079.1 peptide-binding protein [Fischerella thermalis CCMEE 5318]PMB40390.1 peptide-binding protein [Fischerella thermalis CCMEE 5319]PMB42409.1 peptide-binding protein [Fischerella thermalis CCMEE 5205]
MNVLTLQWQDAGQIKIQKIHEKQPSKNPGTIRIGRDPVRCDIVLSHPTVSGLHVEIFFNAQQQRFLMKNLREQNPPLVDGQKLVQGEIPLREGSIIYLGQQLLKVTEISVPGGSTVPPTILTPPQPQATNPPPVPVAQPQVHPNYHQPTPPRQPQPQAAHHPVTPAVQQQPQPQGVYGLQCPRCKKLSSYKNLLLGCQHCGHSLQDALSVLVPPSH